MNTSPPHIQNAYLANYDQIAKDHVAYARANQGGNPFMEPALVETLETATEALVRRYITPGARILDAGCGPGTLLARLGGHGYIGYGIDISRDYIEYASETYPWVEFRDGDLESLPFNPEYDAVICADVLEHVLDEHAVLSELRRVLRPGGHLIIRVPDSEDMSIYNPNSPETYTQTYPYVHLRRFDAHSLEILLTQIHGFTLAEEVSGVSWNDWHELHAVATKP